MMNELETMDEKLIEVVDLLEQIQDLNQMIELHKSDEDDFMLRQYRFRREKFVKHLSDILKPFQIKAVDLTA